MLQGDMRGNVSGAHDFGCGGEQTGSEDGSGKAAFGEHTPDDEKRTGRIGALKKELTAIQGELGALENPRTESECWPLIESWMTVIPGKLGPTRRILIMPVLKRIHWEVRLIDRYAGKAPRTKFRAATRLAALGQAAEWCKAALAKAER